MARACMPINIAENNSDTLASENLLTHGKCGAKSVETQVSRRVMTVAEVTDAATSVSTGGHDDADTRGKK